MVYINNKKIDSFNLSDNNICVVMDFDRTITTNDSMGSWAVLENPDFMNPNFKKESQLLIDEYYPHELDYSLDKETKSTYMQEWYKKNLDLFYKYNLTNDILLNCVKHSDIKFRNGFADFFKDLHFKNIPVIIISAGIGNVIVELLKINNCYYDNVHVFSNFIKFEDNLMLPFTNEIIHTSNKNLAITKHSDIIANKNYIILLGDLIEDLNMIPSKDLNRAVTFGFLEQNVVENFKFYKEAFDIVLTNNSSFDDVERVLIKLFSL